MDGVDLSVNPLVTKTKLNGESSIISPRREGIASIQRLANGTMEYGNYASTTLDMDSKEAGRANMSMICYGILCNRGQP